MNAVTLRVKNALENCVVQMKQASKMFEQDPEWQKAILEGELALDELSKTMEQEHYTLKELDAAMDIANAASLHGYRTTNGRDTRSQYMNWAVEFERGTYNPEDRISEIKKFADQKMVAEVEAGRGKFRETQLSTWHIDSVKKETALLFDPTTPENYLLVMNNKDLMLKHQSALDECFADRTLVIRKQLQNDGWRGEMNFLSADVPLSLTHESLKLAVYFKPTQIKDTGNVVGGVWKIIKENAVTKTWETHEVLTDSLAITPEYVADRLNSIKNKYLNVISKENAISIATDKSGKVEVADADFNKTVQGRILSKTGMHLIQNNGLSVVIYKIKDLDKIPNTGADVSIDFRNGKGKVTIAKEQSKENER